jgi:hypothetical protein
MTLITRARLDMLFPQARDPGEMPPTSTPAGNRRWVGLGAPSRDTGRIRPALALSTEHHGIGKASGRLY